MISITKVADKFPHGLSQKVNEIIDILESPVDVIVSETATGRVERTNAKTVILVPGGGVLFNVCENGIPVQYKIAATKVST